MNIIELDNISKIYKFYNTPKDRLREILNITRKKYHDNFYALQDISFNVKMGESIGIIGVNGSGKSTLLKIICGVLKPTTGNIIVNGRISAILELGAGFNPEFTGRENVLMNGALMGLSRERVYERFPAIESFAEIGDFIDQPVKTYSTGMFVRLAFAAAINVEPDILIIDEALAVGDMYFQHKCINTLNRMRENGKTILFVSHDVESIKGLCQKAVWLDMGYIKEFGKAKKIAELYSKFNRDRLFVSQIESERENILNKQISKPEQDSTNYKFSTIDSIKVTSFQDRIKKNRSGTGEIQFIYIEMTDNRGEAKDTFEYNETIRLNMYLRAKVDVQHYFVAYHIRDWLGIEIAGSDSAVEYFELPPLKTGKILGLRFEFNLPLMIGSYSILTLVTISKIKNPDLSQLWFSDWIDNAQVFNVKERKEAEVWSRVYLPTRITLIEG